MAWKWYSVSTDSWADWIELPGVGTGSRALNAGGGGSTTFHVADPSVAEVVTAATIAPLERILVAEWDGIVKYAGLILTVDADVDKGTVTATHQDIWWLLKFRHVLSIHGEGSQSAAPITYADVTFNTIARGVVFEGADASPSARYALPIVYPDIQAGTETRTYEGFKFVSVADALDELMNTDGGPDIDFSPERSPAGNLEWEMRAGVLTYGPREWDTTVPKSEVKGLKLKTDASRLTNKVIATGEGSAEDLLVKAEESFTGSLRPALERVVSYSGISDIDQLAGRARADLATSNDPIQQLSFSIPVDGPVEVSDLILGGVCRVKTKGVMFLADGWSEWRLIQYDFDKDNVSLQFQQTGG